MNRRLQLINWVKAQHNGQLIKETTLPYFNHLLVVANKVANLGPLIYEVGICHDLFEKTTVTSEELMIKLRTFGYDEQEANHIDSCVIELARHFTKANNPLPKKERKALEDERLTGISMDAQTVKYADFADNADWMMAHDRHHAQDYLKAKIALIKEMTSGDDSLRQDVLAHFNSLLKIFH